MLRNLFRSSVVRFIVVGVVNTLFSYGVYALLIFAGLHYALANLLALIAGILFSFRTHGAFVFNNTSPALFWRFLLIWAVIYLVNVSLIRGGLTFGFDAYIAGALALPPTAVLSYLALKYFVFRRQE